MIRASIAVLFLLALGCNTPGPGVPPPVQPPPVKSADGRRPGAVTISGVSAIPEALFQRLQQYQNIRGASFNDWAPDGKSILISTRFGSTTQLHRVHAPGGRREQVTFLEEPVSGAQYLPDGTVLYSCSAGGSENYQLYRLDFAEGQTTLLTDGKARHNAQARTTDHAKLVVGINRPGEKNTDLYLFDPLHPEKPELLLETKGESWHAVDWSPDNAKLLLLKYVSANESHLHWMDVATRKVSPIPAPGGGISRCHDAQFMRDGGVLVSSDARGEFATLARVDLDTLRYSWITTDIAWDVQRLVKSRDLRQVAFVVNEDGASRLYVIEGEAAPRKVEIPLGVVGELAFSPDGSKLALSINRPDAPGDVYTLEGSELTRWTFSEVGGLNPAKFVVPARTSVVSFDDREVPFYVYRPRAAGKKAPVILNIHGGPEGQFQPFFSGITQYWVNDLGCAVIGPNVRGSTGYGKTYTALDNGIRREDSVRDIAAILDWIAQQPDLDATRVGVIGGSYGGYMTLACLCTYPDRIRAGVDIVGIANFSTFLAKTSPYRQDLRRAEYGDEREPEMQKYFEKISPSNRVASIKSALMVVHGKNDPRVPFAEAELIASKVRESGKPVWTVFADNEGHGFSKKENRDYLTAVTAHFFTEFLLK